MCNNFEHFDERLDRWWRESPNHNAIDLSLTPHTGVGGIDNINWFRIFDPQTTDMTFWGDDFNVQQLLNGVQRILPTLREEANKPHWNAPPAAGE
jgi:hypothetical protein